MYQHPAGVAHATGRRLQLNAQLLSVLTEGVRAVDKRVAEVHAYTHESLEVRAAASEVSRLQARLGLGDFLGSKTPIKGKPQFLLVFAYTGRASTDTCLLKVYGRQRPAEAALQAHWNAVRVPTPTVYEAGNAPVSWLLLEDVPAGPVSPEGRVDVLQHTRQLARIVRHAYLRSPKKLAGARPLGQAVWPHLHAVVATLRRHGYAVPAQWTDSAQASYASGRQLILHGDLYPGNLLQGSDGMLLVDSCGYVGDPSFDAARWSARVSGPDCGAAEILSTWLEADHELDATLAYRMLAAEVLMQAGVHEIRKVEGGHPPSVCDPVTTGLLAAIDDLRVGP